MRWVFSGPEDGDAADIDINSHVTRSSDGHTLTLDIGDMERTFRVFDELSVTEPQDDKHIEFMKKLDDWGVDKSSTTLQFGGFYQDESKLTKSDMEDLGIPDHWRDEDLFRDLDSRAETESVFLNTWLPKFALKIRKDNYRTLLRSLNKKDPEFNVIW